MSPNSTGLCATWSWRRRRRSWADFIVLSLLWTPVYSSSHSEPREDVPDRHLCELDCGSQHANPVCGSDDVTYSNKCALHQAALCSAKPDLRVVHRGACSPVQHQCHEERLEALQASNKSGIPVFVPVCRPDGSYVDVQCHFGTGYCWCVDQEGKPVLGSSIRYDRPNCRRRNSRKRNRRGWGRKRGRSRARSGAKTSSGQRHRKKSKKKGGSKKTKLFYQSDRTEFISEVLELMGSEYRRVHDPRQMDPIGNQNKEVVDWKFDQMDADRDGSLKKQEAKTFFLELKRVSRNKVCARNFWRYCDLDFDKRMTRQEWHTCLGININVSFKLFQSLSSGEDKDRRRDRMRKHRQQHFGHRRIEDEEEEEVQEEEEEEDLAGAPTGEALSEVSIVDCWKENSAALARGSLNTYVPECEDDGTFQSVQCYDSSGYCWCVDPMNGHPIPGTSKHGSRPNCGEDVGAVIMRQAKPWRKCPDHRRRQFRERLLDKLTREMVGEMSEAAFAPSRFLDARLTVEERVAKWKFTALDSNKNGVLSRRELRPFREELKANRRLKLCGKRMLLHCDTDEDKRITETEWEICIGVRNAEIDGPSRISVPTINKDKRRGPNPLKTWLKED